MALSYRGNRQSILIRALQAGVDPTPLALSRAAGISHSTAKRLLSGRTVSAETVVAVAEALHGDPSLLFDTIHPDGHEPGSPSLWLASPRPSASVSGNSSGTPPPPSPNRRPSGPTGSPLCSLPG
jgi:hypothetical protein